MSTHPDHDTIRAAVALAVRAPSVHNTQPWLWRVGDTTVHLYADDSRRLPYTDPDSRELVVSCGAALHHLRVALRAAGWDTDVHRFPNPAEPKHLAALELHRAEPDASAVRLARAISQRRSDRRRFTSWEVPPGQVAAVVAAGAGVTGTQVREVDATGEHARLLQAFVDAATAHRGDPGYNAELAEWSGHHASDQGVPARNAVVPPDATVRPFDDPLLSEAVVHDTDEAARMLVVCTASDDLHGWLSAGEVASAVLLEATVRGLATCALSEPLEITGIRARIRRDLLGDFGYPQLIIRMGWAATSAAPVPATPRLPLEDVVHPLETLRLSGDQ
ncbi:Acg family FMN-binding oxidoreductase [Nocardia niigatensis]|uniref:Acg family FMN-binding oxidoreductase n=1 Tax=Nocardia niigatensis TaxID=209249 RepID=UPI0002D4A2F9|nr:nitroreductase family protein [Nocardia niigatensis]